MYGAGASAPADVVAVGARSAILEAGCPAKPWRRRGARSAARRRSPSRAATRRYCRDCWDKKIAVEEIVAREFALKRYIRAHSAEKYLIYHSTLKRPCGQLIVVDDGYDLFLTMVLYPSFAWDEAAYHLEGDPEGPHLRRDPRRRRRGRGHRAVGRRQVAPRDLPVDQPRARGLERRDVSAYNVAGRRRAAAGRPINPGPRASRCTARRKLLREVVMNRSVFASALTLLFCVRGRFIGSRTGQTRSFTGKNRCSGNPGAGRQGRIRHAAQGRRHGPGHSGDVEIRSEAEGSHHRATRSRTRRRRRSRMLQDRRVLVRQGEDGVDRHPALQAAASSRARSSR